MEPVCELIIVTSDGGREAGELKGIPSRPDRTTASGRELHRTNAGAGRG